MSDRLTNELLTVAASDDAFPYPGSGAVLRRAAREVLASRKLIADLRAWHAPDSARDEDGRRPRCRACNEVCPCPTIRWVDGAGL